MDKDAELTRYKKLLVKAKGAIDAQKTKAEAKSKEIEALKASLESAQARLRTDQDSAEPSRVLRLRSPSTATTNDHWYVPVDGAWTLMSSATKPPCLKQRRVIFTLDAECIFFWWFWTKRI